MGGCFSSGKSNYPSYPPYAAPAYGAPGYGAPGPMLTPAGVATPLGPSVPVAYPQGKKGPPVVPLGPPTPHFNPGLVDTVGAPGTGFGPYGAVNTNPAVLRY